jgi:hypothetical protein
MDPTSSVRTHKSKVIATAAYCLFDQLTGNHGSSNLQQSNDNQTLNMPPVLATSSTTLWQGVGSMTSFTFDGVAFACNVASELWKTQSMPKASEQASTAALYF